MATTILVKRSATGGTTPVTLQPGELALSLTSGVLFYGDGQGQVQVSSTPVHVGPASDLIADPRDGMIRYDPNTKNMRVYSESTLTWEIVGFPQSGGTVESHLSIIIEGDVFFQTLYDEETNLPKVILADTEVRSDLQVNNNLTVTGTTQTKVLNVDDDVVIGKSLEANSVSKAQGGGYAYWPDAGQSAARIFVLPESQLDTIEDAQAGDIYFGYEE